MLNFYDQNLVNNILKGIYSLLSLCLENRKELIIKHDKNLLYNTLENLRNKRELSDEIFDITEDIIEDFF